VQSTRSFQTAQAVANPAVNTIPIAKHFVGFPATTAGARGGGAESVCGDTASELRLAGRPDRAGTPGSAIDGSDADIFDQTDHPTFARPAKEGGWD
jgi:hypothetical protein